MQFEYEFIRHQKGLPFRAYFVSVGQISYHWHSDLEIMWVLRGEAYLQTRTGDMVLKAGDIYVVNAYDIHSLYSEDPDNLLLGLQVGGDMVSDFLWNFGEISFEKTFIEKGQAEKTGCYELMAGIMMKLRIARPQDMLRASAMVYELLALITDDLPYMTLSKQRARIKVSDFERLQGIITYVNEHYQEKISLQIVAEQFFISRFHLSHFIKDRLGIGFQVFVNRVRLNHAYDAIMHTDMTMIEIAETCGFSDVKYLTKLVKDAYGVTPMALRKQYHGKEREAGNVKQGHRPMNVEEGFTILGAYAN